MKDRIFFTHTRVQVAYWDLDYKNRKRVGGQEGIEETPQSEIERQLLNTEHSAAFREWYEGAEGAADVAAYAKDHDMSAIERGDGMDILLRSFLAFLNRRRESLLPVRDE